jgi:hypothetical protein
VLINKGRTPFRVTARSPRPGVDETFDSTSNRYCQQTKTQHSAKLANTPIVFSSLPAFRSPDCKPNLITCRCPIDALEKEFKSEAEFQFTNDDDRWPIASQSDKIAATDFTLHLEAERLEVPLYRKVQVALGDSCHSQSERALDGVSIVVIRI